MAFRRSAWEAVNGFPEDLAFAEDTVFAKRLREDGQRFAFVPSALVFWTPRRSLGSVVRQGWNYGRGDGLARISGATYARMHARYAVWLALTAGSAFTPWCVALLALSLLPYWSLWSAQGFRATRDWRAIILTPAIKLSFDAGRLSGYWAGRLG
jgi:cellulose synthase/poly-beta-1,6-N-acetylglucosamine synthase-like glycosyltransferase